MNQNNFISTTVSPQLLDRSRRYGLGVCENYKHGKSERSRLTGVTNRLIDKDPITQMYGKIGECAAAQICGLDPNTDLDWRTHADGGWDFIYAGMKIDAKTTPHPKGKLLIWPSTKAHYYDDVDFNALLLVWCAKQNTPYFGNCEARGWILKDAFKEKCWPAQHGDPRKLEVGSLCLEQDRLESMDDLLWLEELSRNIAI